MFLYHVDVPPRDELLPDPLRSPYYQPPYTLVIEISDLLLHVERSFRSRALSYRKRPGLDSFINQIKYPLFEVVLFTREPYHTGAPIMASLDPYKSIQFKLFRESTHLVDNHCVKDLSCMNRDLSKIILLDWDTNSYRLQPRNALHGLKRWTGDTNDTQLYSLASFLKMIASSQVCDVREILDNFNKEKNPLEAFIFNKIELEDTETDDSDE